MKYIWRGYRYEAEDRDREECFGNIEKCPTGDEYWIGRIQGKYFAMSFYFSSVEGAMKWVEENLPKYVLEAYNFLLQEAEQFKKDYYPY